MPIIIKGQTYSLGPLGGIIALLVLVACLVIWLAGSLTAGLTLLLIAALALAILL